MSRKTRTDYNNIFDNGLDNMSDLVNAFTKKNKRVHRIFDDDDDDVQVNEQSYGLRLVSVHESEATTSKQISSDKENGTEPARRNSTNVRALSPVQIFEALPEQILETRSPFKQPSQLSNRQNVSLRRSLFQQQPKNKNNDLICSTPSTRNQAISNDFFGASSSRIENLSPIRKGLSSTIITEEDLNGIALIPPENNKNGQNGRVVQSLQNLEKDLREQFQIDQETTPKKSYSKSHIGETSRRAISETKNVPSPSRQSFRSEPISRSQPTRDCSVVVEPMEISKDAISMYRKTQLSRLSTSNLTNVNTFNMIETPIARQTKHSVINDSLLAKKLALCESDSEITDDESEKQSGNEVRRRTGNATPAIVPESSKISKPKSTKGGNQKSNEKNCTMHLRLTTSVKNKKSKIDSGKRTQLNQTSDDEQPENSAATNAENEHSGIDPIAQELSQIHRSGDTMSNGSSKLFIAEIPETNPNDDDSEDESPQKKGKTPNKKRIVDESDEEIEDVQEVPKKRGRPKKNKEPVEQQKDKEKKGRGRPKKNDINSKKSDKKQRNIATNESDEEMEESEPKSSNVGKKSNVTEKPVEKRQNKKTEPTKKPHREATNSTNEESDYEISENTENMIETPIPGQDKDPVVNESDSDITNDESEEQSESEGSESEGEARNHTKKKQTEQDIQFKKPGLIKKSLREAVSCNLSNKSAGSLVPFEIIESFRTLQKPGNDTAGTIVPESSKLPRQNRTKGKNINPNKDKVTEYLRLEKSVKHKKTKNDSGKGRKRTLFNQNSDDEQPESSAATNEHSDIDPIDQELSKELSQVRRSLDTMSNASSQPFTAEIPEVNSNDDYSEDESPKKKGKTPKKRRVVDESDEEMEDIQEVPKQRGGSKKNKEPVEQQKDQQKKGRGRPKKNDVNSKKSDKKQQSTATNESDEEMEESEPTSSNVKDLQRRMAKELKTLAQKPYRKRQNNTADDTEPPNKTSRRAASNNSEESNSETSKNTDEGFQSNEEYDSIWYDPAERGCQRQGLRVRKFMRSRDNKYAIRYGVFTRDDSKAISLQKKYKIKESEVHDPSLASFIQPGNRLELVKALIMERKINPLPPPKKKEMAPKNKIIAEKINDGASTSHQAMETESLASFATVRTNETQSGVISRILDSFNRLKDESVNPINLVETATYAISQINRLVWHQIGTGVFYSSFKENSFDGFLKLVKGGYKKGAKTKLAVVKMTLLCGVVDIKINDTKLRIENLGFITITRGQSYRIVNASDETAVILMTRLDDDESTSPNQNSSSS